MRRFFAPPENFSNSQIELNLGESKHLRDVLRLRTGDAVSVFDGTGNEFACVIETIGRKNENVKLRILEKIEPPAPESNLNLTLAVALLKGEKFDLVVQKAAELGVNRVVPLETKRADVRIKDERDAARRLERWRRVALEAAKQSGRAVVPTIEPPLIFEKFIENNSGVFFVERGGGKLNQTRHEEIKDLSAIVGAEGGWEDFEIELARQNDFQIVTLGGRILRAETAAITAAVLMQNLYGDLK